MAGRHVFVISHRDIKKRGETSCEVRPMFIVLTKVHSVRAYFCSNTSSPTIEGKGKRYGPPAKGELMLAGSERTEPKQNTAPNRSSVQNPLSGQPGENSKSMKIELASTPTLSSTGVAGSSKPQMM